MKVANEKVIVNADASADFESKPILIDQIYGFGFQAIFTGSPSGVLKIQASNDDVYMSDLVVNWTDVADSSATLAAAGDVMYNFNGAFYKWIKLVYIASSGSGICNATFLAKGA